MVIECYGYFARCQRGHVLLTPCRHYSLDTYSCSLTAYGCRCAPLARPPPRQSGRLRSGRCGARQRCATAVAEAGRRTWRRRLRGSARLRSGGGWQWRGTRRGRRAQRPIWWRSDARSRGRGAGQRRSRRWQRRARGRKTCRRGGMVKKCPGSPQPTRQPTALECLITALSAHLTIAGVAAEALGVIIRSLDRRRGSGRLR